MLNVRIYAQVTLCALLLTSAACNNNDKKASIKNSERAETDEATVNSKWLDGVVVRVTDNGNKNVKNCFQLDELTRRIEALRNEALTIQLVDINFVKEVQTRQLDGKKKPIEGIYHQPVEGDVGTQIAKNFFSGDRRQSLIRTLPANQLLALTGEMRAFFDVETHAKCAPVVTFKSGPGVFQVKSQNQRRIQITSSASHRGGEVRTYEIDQKGRLTLTVVKPYRGLGTCGTDQKDSHLMSRTFLIMPTDTVKGTMVSEHLAGLLNSHIYKWTDEAQRPRRNSRYVKVNPQLLNYMSEQIANDKVVVKCQ